MANDPAMTVRAFGSKCLNRTLETVEDVLFAICFNAEALVVIIPTNFTSGHKHSFLDPCGQSLDEKPALRVCLSSVKLCFSAFPLSIGPLLHLLIRNDLVKEALRDPGNS